MSPKFSHSEAVQHIWPCNLLSWCNCTCTCLSWYLLMIFFEKFIIFLFHYFTVNLFFHLYLHLSLLSPAADCCFRIWHFFPNMGEESDLTWDSVDFLCINYLIFVTNIKYICVIDICHKYIYTYMCINYLARLGIAEHGLCWVDMQGKTGTWTYLDKNVSQICIARSLFCCTARYINSQHTHFVWFFCSLSSLLHVIRGV